MDDEDLDLLRKCLPGNKEWRPESKSDADRGAFNPWGDRLLALRDRGLLDIPDGLIQYDHQSGPGKYFRIGVRRVTADGIRELRRHDPPAAEIIGAIDAKVGQDLEDRRRTFGTQYGEQTSRDAGKGRLHSSMFVQAVRELVEREYRERGQLLLRTWREVLAA